MKRPFLSSLTMAGVLALALALASVATTQARPHVATGSITGKVVDSSGQPVSGAIVRIVMLRPGMQHHGKHHGKRGGKRHGGIQPGQTVWHTVFGVTKTASDGSFTVDNAKHGRYRVIVKKRGVGFGRLRRPITVSANSVAPVSAGFITLHKGKRKGHKHKGWRKQH